MTKTVTKTNDKVIIKLVGDVTMGKGSTEIGQVEYELDRLGNRDLVIDFLECGDRGRQPFGGFFIAEEECFDIIANLLTNTKTDKRVTIYSKKAWIFDELAASLKRNIDLASNSRGPTPQMPYLVLKSSYDAE
jgi:hypothetical protein